MSKCDLTVRFADDRTTYRPGDTVRGEVVVRVDEDVSCKALRIALGWQTHGMGNTDRRVLDETIIEAQAWSPGQPYSYPFSFTAPRYPLTYHGHFLNVDHCVEAQVDLPWALDPRSSEDYVLEAGPSTPGDYLTAPMDFSQPLKTGQSSWLGKAIGWLFLPVILVLLLMLLAMLIPILLVIGAVYVVRRFLAQRRIGGAQVLVEAPVVQADAESSGVAATASKLGRKWRRQVYAITPGEEVRCRVRFTPKQELKVTRVVATLLGQEECRSGSGTNARTHKHKVCEQEIVLAGEASYMAQLPVEVAGTIPIPETDAYSFQATENKLVWTLKVVVDLPHWVDWTEDVQLRLVPGESAA